MYELITITPEEIDKLAFIKENRSVDKNDVLKLSKDVIDGNLIQLPTVMPVDSKGRLMTVGYETEEPLSEPHKGKPMYIVNDGQHRTLLLLVELGLPITMVVNKSIDRDDIKRVNANKNVWSNENRIENLSILGNKCAQLVDDKFNGSWLGSYNKLGRKERANDGWKQHFTFSTVLAAYYNENTGASTAVKNNEYLSNPNKGHFILSNLVRMKSKFEADKGFNSINAVRALGYIFAIFPSFNLDIVDQKVVFNHQHKSYIKLAYEILDVYFDKYKNEPTFTKEMRDIILKRDHTCLATGSDEDLEIDHVLPKSKNGLTLLSNAQLLCKSKNIEKTNKYDGAQWDFRQKELRRATDFNYNKI